MAEILVKTPMTTDGVNVVLGADGRIRYTESILGIAAKPILEKMNNQKQQALKMIIEDYKPAAEKVTEPLKETVKKEKPNDSK